MAVSKFIFNPSVSSLFLVWFAFWYRGVLDTALSLIGNIPAWFVALLVVSLSILLYRGRSFRRFITVPELLIIALLFLMVPSAILGGKMESFSIISMLLSVTICVVWGKFRSLKLTEKQFFCDFAFVTSLLAVLMFLYFVFVEPPKLGVDEIRPGYGYAIDRGVLLRLVGFTSDPNFYALGLILPFLICLKERQMKRRKLYIFVYLISIVFTFSRSGALVFGFSVFLLFLSDAKRFYPAIIYSIAASALGVVALFIYGSIFLVSNGSTVDRSLSTGFLSRFNLIEKILASADLNFWGAGIGKSKELIGFHSHNTYFDYLFEGGWLAFAFFCLYIVAISSRMISNLNPLSIFVLAIFVSIFSVSLPFNPIVFLIPLVAVRSSYREN